MPFLFLIPVLSPYPKYKQAAIQSGYHQLVETVNELGKKGPVLFINERQMVTFGDVNVPLVPDYEVVTLMDPGIGSVHPAGLVVDAVQHRIQNL